MAIQKFTGKLIGVPTMAETANTHKLVLHVDIGFIPSVKIDGKLPDLGKNGVNRVRLSIWDEEFQQEVMTNADTLSGKMVTGYLDNIVERNGFYNATGYAFVLDEKGKLNPPQIQVIHASAPSAPVAPV